MASPKPLATALSILFVVGIAIGLIVSVRMVNNVKEYDPIDLSSASKTVRAFCSPTDYKKACVSSLSGLDRNESATPMDYLGVSICAAINAVNATIDKANFLSKETKEPEQKDALVDCTTLLSFAIDELQQALSSVREVSMNKIMSKEDDLKNWLSATISYQQSCLDIIESPQKEEMTHGTKDATELTSNTLAMVSDFKGIFKSLGMDNSQNRRLLSDIKPDGYPRWLSARDRKLLEVKDMRPTGKANVVVARDGSGQFKTINDAISTYPKGFKGRYVIYVKAGLYKEQVTIGKDMKNVFMYGDGPRRTIVTGD